MFYTRFFAGFVPASGAWRDVRLTVDGVVLSRGGWRGRVRKALAVGGILWAAAGAWAADYVFPGQMPAGCSGSGGNYVCGDLSLKYRDTVRISGALPAKITINGSLDTDTAQVNALGASGNLSLVVSGDVRLGYATVLNAQVTARSISDSSGSVTVGGSLTATSGSINLAFATSVAGALSAGSGNIRLESFNVVGGDITAGGSVYIGYWGRVSGKVTAKSLSDGGAVVYSGAINTSDGRISLGYFSSVIGDVTASKGGIELLGLNDVQGCVWSKDGSDIALSWVSSADGVCCGTGNCNKSCLKNGSGWNAPPLCSARVAVALLDHLEVQHASGAGLTCTPSTLTVVACQDANCTTRYTGGVAGTLKTSGLSVGWPLGAAFTIPAGSSTASVDLQLLSPGTVTVGAVAALPLASNASTCNFGSPRCAFTAADSGFVMSVGNHVADTPQTLNIAAVQSVAKGSMPSVCAPAFVNVSKLVNLGCGYGDPATGSQPVRVGGVPLNAAGALGAACDGKLRALNLAFNASGVASTTLQYADVGKVVLNAVLADAVAATGLSMQGSGSFVTAPAAFKIEPVTAGVLRAGVPFSVAVSALNGSGLLTPNFGKEAVPEGVVLAWRKASPVGTSASDGTFTGSGVAPKPAWTAFSGGVAALSDLAWSEVGSGDLTATLASGSYLASGQTVVGSTGNLGAIGRFVPHHFDVGVTPACGAFTYSSQPFAVAVTARNAAGGTTLNHDGSGALSPGLASVLTLTEATGAGQGSFSVNRIAKSAFVSGVARSLEPAYAFTSKLTAPRSIVVRATDADGVSSLGSAEGSMLLRSGRLRLSNAYGTEKRALDVPVQAQYWSGQAWVLNSLDSCTSVPSAAVVMGSQVNAQGRATAAWASAVAPQAGGQAIKLMGGNGVLTLKAPTPMGTGSLDVALNLGSDASDVSCLSLPRPVSVGAGLPWLRAQFGSTNGCVGVVDFGRDPSARVTFGVYTPENKRIGHVADIQ